MMRAIDRYRQILENNPGASVGFNLAAGMVYAAFCTPYKDNASELSFRQNLVERQDIALYLKNKYGERLTVDKVTTEMDNAISGTGEWLRDIVLYLKNKYGERLTADKVTTEMDNAINGTGAWLPINGKPQGDES